MNRGDALVEKGANRLEELAQAWAADGGAKAKLAERLWEDAAFLRKLKPTLIAARARGEAPTDQEPGAPTVAPSGPQLGARPKAPGTGGPNPFVVVAGALVLGVFMAKLIDWRSHRYPRN